MESVISIVFSILRCPCFLWKNKFWLFSWRNLHFLFYKVSYIAKNEQNLILWKKMLNKSFLWVLSLWLCYLGPNKTFDTHIAMVLTNCEIFPYPTFWVFWAFWGVWGYDILCWNHGNMGIKSFFMTQISHPKWQSP